MLKDHFYHAILRKSVAVFGTIFNDITIAKKTSSGGLTDIQRVPLAYGPKAKFLARIDQQASLTDPKVAIKLPRMSFEITSLQLDATSIVSTQNTLVKSTALNDKTSISQITPYVLGVQLNILAKNQDDALQITEQILPYFRPTYTVSVKFIDGLEKSFDVPITLTGVTLTDDYEGDSSSRRSLIYTLDFDMKIKFFGGTDKKSIIKEVKVDVNNTDFGFMENVKVTDSGTVISGNEND